MGDKVMKQKRNFREIFFFMICFLIPLYAFCDTCIDIANKSINIREKITNNPMKVEYTLEETRFYPNYKILRFLPDDKVVIERSDIKHKTQDGVRITTGTLNYSNQYNLPYGDATRRIVIVWDEKRYQLKEYWSNKSDPKIIETYDGSTTKIYFAPEHRSTKTCKTYIKKYGQTYKGKIPRFKQFTFYPYEVWFRFKINQEFPMKTLSDNTILIDNARQYSYKKSEIIVSPKDQYMILSRDIIEKDDSRSIVKVNKTVNLGGFVFPSDVEKKEYDSYERPLLFAHYYNFSYQILQKEEVENICQFEFPEGTEIGTFPFFPDDKMED